MCAHVAELGDGRTGMSFPLFLVFLCGFLVIAAESYDVEGSNSGKAFQFKVELRSGTQECFYETLRTNASLYSAFQVISVGLGGEYAASLSIKHLPTYQPIYNSPWEGHAYLNLEEVQHGTYEFCLNNMPSYTTKVVFLYIEYHERVDWEKSVNDDQNYYGDIKRDTLTASLHTIQLSVEKMLFHNHLYEQRSNYQEHTIMELSQLVYYASIGLCMAIIASGFSQTAALKHLFKSKLTKGPPRA